MECDSAIELEMVKRLTPSRIIIDFVQHVSLSLSAIFAFRTWFPTSHPELFQRHLHANDESCNQDWEATSRARRVKQFVMWEKVFLSIKIRVFRIRFDPCGQSSLSFNDENNEKSENIFLPPTTLTTPLRGKRFPKRCNLISQNFSAAVDLSHEKSNSGEKQFAQ